MFLQIFRNPTTLQPKVNLQRDTWNLSGSTATEDATVETILYGLASGEVVYFAASVAVIYNPESNTQRHFTHHTDDIKCIAVHPDGKTVATGQVKGRESILVNPYEPHVCIWDSESLEVLHVIGTGTINRAATSVAFSKDGGILAVVDDAPEPVLSVWNWPDERMIANNKAGSPPVLGVTFTAETPFRIVTSGKNHLNFWSLFGEGELGKRSALFGEYEKPKFVPSVVALDSGEILTGDSNGNILIWEKGTNTIKTGLKEAFGGAIFHVMMTEFGNIVASGKGRKIVEFNSELERTGESFAGHLEELWGLAVHHSEPHFLTAGRDNDVHYIDASSHEIKWTKDLEFACQSADMNGSSTITVIGGSSGKWVAIENESQELVYQGENGEEPIQVTRFSPDSTKLALGSRDNKVYIYTVEEDGKSYTKHGECEGHSSFVTHLDWSKDGAILRTNSGDYEVLHWKTEECIQILQSEEYKDVEWATNNCILSFNAVGIWPPGTDGTHINSFSLRLTRSAKHKKYHGHSSHITNVCFLHDDSCIISTGGRDTSTLQWKVLQPDEEEEEEENGKSDE
ncbi:Echinoderm microtubule-associated protein-like 2 [Armadillidium vulgare]|nr:Echinoderm microtubule-associated protein-like 2 [Armadillidium vulgare]